MLYKRVIEPDNNHAPKGIMIGWLSGDGHVRTWFFTASGKSEESVAKHARILTKEGERSIPISGAMTGTVKATGLDRPTMDYLSSIIRSNYVFIIEKEWPLKTKLVSLGNAKTKSGGAIKGYSFTMQYTIHDNNLLKS